MIENNLSNNNERYAYRNENTFLNDNINEKEHVNDDDTFFTSSYFDIIFVVMVASVLLMVIILMYDMYNDMMNDTLETDTNNIYGRHHHYRNKSYSDYPRQYNYKQEMKKHRRRCYSYSGFDHKLLGELVYQNYLKKMKKDHHRSKMIMTNYSGIGINDYNHYNKNVEITGNGDYTPPGFLELLWMTFSSVLDITTDIWYAESLFTNNVEIHYNNKWIFQVMSILTIAIPILLNMTLSFSLISRRLKASFDFLNWYRTAPGAKKSTSFFVLFSAFNIELLSILVSELWGLACFSAPIGIDDFWFRLKFWGFITTLVEDIPQFLIQFLILYPQIRSGKINTLVVVKLIISAVVLFVDCISKGLIWYAMGSSISPPKKNKELPFNEQATLGFPTSYSYADIDNDPTFESLDYSMTNSPRNHHHHHYHHHHHKSPYDSIISTGYSNDSRMNNYSSYYNDNSSFTLPKRKYYNIEENYKDQLKKTSIKYPLFTFKNDSTIDIVDSETNLLYNNKNTKFQNPHDKILSKFKIASQYPSEDDESSYYIESSHSQSLYTDNVEDITESLCISLANNPNNYINNYFPPQNKSSEKRNGQNQNEIGNGNRGPSLYSKNAIIHRKGLALPEIKLEKSPSLIPPHTYGNIKKNSYHYNNGRNSTNSASMKKLNNKRYEESDISKEISKIQN
ncbi:hypothetical protein LY90DRAFT_674148 [Neocallimastix californiae]|uniref:Uncharacterized protein n=1 Tax=Neocallimastix californiae TaxID=1754190 RepID=A0A1Y2B0L4_9FUNG|nr:hypothetical protein LY90DRAFT_674148 [Neocallimastix californiae]|eukprot:ORY28361.1 hypothetical protein LY90DRAFT_674148 [Neocallimastix californiae]